MNFQISSEAVLQAGVEGDPVSTSVTVGSTFVSVLVFSTIILTLAFLASDKLYNFMASAFPLLAVRIFGGQMPENRSMSGMVFGLTAKLLIIAVVLTPITAATTNRVWALTDGPTQVGQTFASNLQNMKIAELKKYLNPKAKTSKKWLSDSILAAAQPADGFGSNVAVTNFLDKPWTPGNLDAVVEVTLSKDGKSFSYIFDTESAVTNPSWLITHVDYTPLLSPGEIDIVANKLFPASKLKTLTINGKKAKVGEFFSIPGTYTVKADGYKLIAPTEETFYSSKIDSLMIGYKILLPDGADKKLNNSILESAKDCFKLTPSGNSECVNVKKLSPVVVSGVEPDKYFDYQDSSYKVSGIKCSTDRTDVLTSATTEKSKAKCSAVVEFKRTYFKSEPKRVPNQVTVERCVGAMISDYWSTSGEVLTYRYGEWQDSEGFPYYDWERHYEPCHSTKLDVVESGFKTIQVRGSTIASVQMTADFNKTMTTSGKLLDNGVFQISK
jgi:hypothetical protein